MGMGMGKILIMLIKKGVDKEMRATLVEQKKEANPQEKEQQETDIRWDMVIKPQAHLLDLNFQELWHYRDLLSMFVKRDVVTVYKQTILGPIWFVIQPILTVLVFMLIFGKIAGLSTDGLPMVLFYLSGVIVWNYFAESFNSTSKTFIENADIFGKVYFPRLVMPLSKVTSGLIRFGIQFALFLLFFAYYYFFSNSINPNLYILLLPYFILLMAGYGLGLGIIFSSLTTKYRDLTFLIQFGVQLVMYATPVIYPLSSVEGKFRILLMVNPFTHIIEGFRYAFLGSGTFTWEGLTYATVVMCFFLVVGIITFNKVEKTFMDTV